MKRESEMRAHHRDVSTSLSQIVVLFGSSGPIPEMELSWNFCQDLEPCSQMHSLVHSSGFKSAVRSRSHNNMQLGCAAVEEKKRKQL